MPNVAARSAIEAPLTAWFADRLALDPGSVRVALDKPKTGFSADTLLVTLRGHQGGDEFVGDYVVRIERPGRHTFLGSSIVKQAQMMRQLREHGLPAPKIIDVEPRTELAGGSFLAMERVAGLVLPQHPSYHVTGLLLTLSERQRSACWRGALSTMGSINRLVWQGQFAFLHDEAYGPAGLGNYLAWLSAWRDDACAGRPHPVADQALIQLHRDQPAKAGCELLWGDANPGNFLFADDGAVTAVLDFEAAAIGPAEIDLSWWLFVDEMLAGGQPSPAGIPARAEQVEAFETALGRPAADLNYYAILSALRMTLVVARLGLLLIGDGVLPPDSTAWRANPAASRLAELTGVPADEDLTDYWELVRLMNTR